MARGFIDQVSEDIFNIPAAGGQGNIDATYTKYIDVRSARRTGHEVEWTAGASGTLVIKAYFTMHEFIHEGAALAGDSGSVFQEYTSKLFGSPLTGTSIVTDSKGIAGCPTWIKYVAVVATSDATTTLLARINKCS